MRARSLASALALLCPIAAVAFDDGDGSSGDPYQISTCAQLDSIRNVPNWQLQDYLLVGNIDCSSFGTFATIANANFEGTFDGGNFAIDGLTISGTAYVGLFQWLQAGSVVRDLSITNADVTLTGNGNVGILAGYASSIGTPLLQISNVYTSGTITVNANSGTVGGMTGVMASPDVDRVHSDVTIFITGPGSNSLRAGGLTGVVSGNGTLEYASASGSLNRSGGTMSTLTLGGLVGSLLGNVDCVECASTTTITATGTDGGSVGGLVGQLGNGGTTFTPGILDSYAQGSVTATDSGTRVGGLVGSIDVADVTRAYATGAVNGPTTTTGGLVGSIEGAVTLDDVFAAPSSLSAGAYGISETFPGFSSAVFNDYGGPAGCTSMPTPACVTSSAPQADFYLSSTAPMTQWDFTNVWLETPGEYPTLRNTSVHAGGGGVSCIVGSPYDWDGDLTDDGCRGTNVVIADGVTVPAGTQMGDNVMVMAGSVLGTGNVLYNGVTMAPGASLGNNNTLQTGVILGRRATVGTGVTLLANTTVGRTASIGDNSQVGGSLGYASQVGSNVSLPDIVLGNLAAIGSPTTPAGAITCPGPLVLARSTAVAVDPTHTFACTGLVVMGPESTIESADVASNIRIRRQSYLSSLVTAGSDIRLGRGVQLGGGVELADDTRIAAAVELCGTAAPFSGFLPRTYIDPDCP